MPIETEEKSFLELELQLPDGNWITSEQYPPDMSTNHYPPSDESWRLYCALLNSCDMVNSYRLVRVNVLRSESREVVS